MALTAQLFTVSGLSVEFGMDKRTIGKRLDSANIRPAEIRRKIKYYRLIDIIPALELEERPDKRSGGDEVEERTYNFIINVTLGMFNEFAGPLACNLKTDPNLKLSSEEVWRIIELKFLWLLIGLGKAVEDPELAVEIPDVIQKLENPKERKKLIKWLDKKAGEIINDPDSDLPKSTPGRSADGIGSHHNEEIKKINRRLPCRKIKV